LPKDLFYEQIYVILKENNCKNNHLSDKSGDFLSYIHFFAESENLRYFQLRLIDKIVQKQESRTMPWPKSNKKAHQFGGLWGKIVFDQFLCLRLNLTA
jgi:hypothetical protein